MTVTIPFLALAVFVSHGVTRCLGKGIGNTYLPWQTLWTHTAIAMIIEYGIAW